MQPFSIWPTGGVEKSSKKANVSLFLQVFREKTNVENLEGILSASRSRVSD